MSPRAPHLLAGDHPLVAVTDRPRGERREVGPGAGLGEELAPHLVVADDRREEASLLLVSAPGQGRRTCEGQPQGVEAAEIEPRPLALDRTREPAGQAETLLR